MCVSLFFAPTVQRHHCELPKSVGSCSSLGMWTNVEIQRYERHFSTCNAPAEFYLQMFSTSFAELIHPHTHTRTPESLNRLLAGIATDRFLISPPRPVRVAPGPPCLRWLSSKRWETGCFAHDFGHKHDRYELLIGEPDHRMPGGVLEFHRKDLVNGSHD